MNKKKKKQYTVLFFVNSKIPFVLLSYTIIPGEGGGGVRAFR